MSLSSHWRRRESPLRRFFDSRFNMAPTLQADWRSAVGDRQLWLPYPDGVQPPGTLGWVFEYRVRLALGDSFTSLSGWRGMRLLTSRDARVAVASWAEGATDEQIVGLPGEEVTRECFVLAWLEELYRGGPRVRSPLLNLPYGSDRLQVLELVDQRWVDDVTMMVDPISRRTKRRRFHARTSVNSPPICCWITTTSTRFAT
jgi:hypothetical protein